MLSSYLWPGYSDSSTNHHVLLIILITTVKNREGLQVWGNTRDQLSSPTS